MCVQAPTGACRGCGILWSWMRCKWSTMDAGIRTQGLYQNSRCSQPLSYLCIESHYVALAGLDSPSSSGWPQTLRDPLAFDS